MRKQAEASAAAEGARRATGAGASRRGRFRPRRKRETVLRLRRGEDPLWAHTSEAGPRTRMPPTVACDARRMTPPGAIVACRRAGRSSAGRSPLPAAPAEIETRVVVGAVEAER